MDSKNLKKEFNRKKYIKYLCCYVAVFTMLCVFYFSQQYKKMSFLKISDPKKRDEIVKEFIEKKKKNISG